MDMTCTGLAAYGLTLNTKADLLVKAANGITTMSVACAISIEPMEAVPLGGRDNLSFKNKMVLYKNLSFIMYFV